MLSTASALCFLHVAMHTELCGCVVMLCAPVLGSAVAALCTFFVLL